jgi:hypothetical protein
MTAEAPVPDLAQLNPLELWLASIRRLADQGVPLAQARQLADRQAGFGTTT